MLKFLQRFRILPILFVAVVVCFTLAHPALAAENVGSMLGKFGMSAFAGLFSIIIILIALLSIIIAILLGDLMTSFYIFDSGMGDTLHLVWEVMRNFVNIVFILALLVIAIRVIFDIGEGGGTGFLKKILPKFIIALVAVNLTFFAARFVVGTADVLATAVFAIPKTVVGEKMIRGVPCAKTYAEFQTSRQWDAQKCSDEVQGLLKSNDAAQKKFNEKEVSDFGEMLKKISNATVVNTKIKDLVTKENFALVLLMNILRLDDLVWLKSVGGIEDLVVGGLGSIIMAGAVGVVYFMLFVAFLIRVVILWIMIPLMPLGVLAMVMKEVVPGMPEAGGGTFSLSGFIKTAMMPVFVAFPLSIGMVMIFANNSIASLDGVSIVSVSAFSKHFNVILWWAASIGVIWFGTNEAIKMGNEMAGKYTESIHQKVGGAVSAVAGTAKYLPIIPGFGGDGKLSSLASISKAKDLAFNSMEEHSTGRSRDIAKSLGIDLNSLASPKVGQFARSTDKTEQTKLLQTPEVRSGLMKETHEQEVITAREVILKNAKVDITTPEVKSKLKTAAGFKELIEKHAAGVDSYYGKGTAEEIRSAAPTPAQPATAPTAGTPPTAPAQPAATPAAGTTPPATPPHP